MIDYNYTYPLIDVFTSTQFICMDENKDFYFRIQSDTGYEEITPASDYEVCIWLEENGFAEEVLSLFHCDLKSRTLQRN